MSGDGKQPPHGVLNLFKPSGPTSHDCVARVRRALGTRKVGHAGTLDPLARGVLVVGVGNGTRVLQFLQGLPKTYRARMVLGISTDSQDVTGTIVSEADASGVTREAVADQLRARLGEQQQVPPMVSALKVEGRKLYELARRGETVEREPRPVTIHEIELLDFQPGVRAEAEFRVRCSSGTYVRTLCHDIGAALGVGAAMSALEREAVGEFRATEAVPLEALGPHTPLMSLAEALRHLPGVSVSPADLQRLAFGQRIPAPPATPAGPLRLLSPEGELVAIGTAAGEGEARVIAPEKVFCTPDAAHSRS